MEAQGIDMANIQGTSDNDSLVDTAADDTIDGLGGNDSITSTLGGFDTIAGGTGNDTIFVSRSDSNAFGPITVDGGDGNDFIRFGDLKQYSAAVTGGAGSDRIEIDTRTLGAYATIDAGADNDVIVLNAGVESILTTGSGADVVIFTAHGATNTQLHVSITDFTAGAGGDRVDFGGFLNLLLGWDDSTNPFATGHLFLAQQGANTTLFLDRDGSAGSGNVLNQLITFENIAMGSLTAYNFFGYAPDGSPLAPLVIDGTANDDVLNGEAGGDTIHGLGGNDIIDGKNGADVIYGDDGNDILYDYEGSRAELYGGAGNDRLIVVRDSPSYITTTSTVDGGDDNDIIDVTNANAAMIILGGGGNDTVRLLGALGGSPIVDLGAGNDTFLVALSGVELTLGAGADTVRYEVAQRSVTVYDFETGAGGDSIDVTSALVLHSKNWNYSTNPFATGHASLLQQGSDVLVQLDFDGTGGGSLKTTIARLQNTLVASLTADNLGGWNPNGAQPAGQIIAGTAGPDTLTGGIGGDTIRGLGGNDVIFGYVGDDTIDGGSEEDRLDGQWGADVVDGGAGNDILLDSIDGNDTLRGGDGNDLITLTRTQSKFDHGPSTVLLDGGAGNDRIQIVARGDEVGEFVIATIFGGTGDDLVTIGGMQDGSVDLGDGADRLEFTGITQRINGQFNLGPGQDVIVYNRPVVDPATRWILDFQAGDSGDRLELLGFLPISFVQQGADTLVIETINATARTVLTLRNVQASQLTAYNTGGALTGTAGPDTINGNDAANTIHGQAGDDQINGLGGNDQLYGDDGNDMLDGGTGADRLDGGPGNDTFFVDNPGDLIVETTNQGHDTVYSSVDYTLDQDANVEVLSARTHAATDPLSLTGNGHSQEIWGNAGANVLRGGGGVDFLIGLGGNDSYFLYDPNDLVFESAGGGRDVVYSPFDYTLLAGQEIEVLSANNHSATTPLNLTGNALGQEIWGNAGVNNLRGGGGNDFLLGLGGSDNYFVDTASAYVFETAGGGARDVVYSSVSYALLAGQEVEVLSAGDHGATTAIGLTGNELGQEIWGNAGANNLRGGGGTDFLLGLGGSDNYFVDVAQTQVYEAAAGGRDVIYSSVNYALLAGQEIEVLSTSSHAATAALDMTGNEFAQELWGNAGANTLDGKLGNDALIGQSGADTFAFTTALGANNVDLIVDFLSGTDRIALDDAVFTGLGLGALPAGAFVTGSAAGDADDRIIYNSATGQLYFDADGTGSGAAVQFAALNGHPVITASDFIVI
jgi:Ca2+-binding RTX toxin-like protein